MTNSMDKKSSMKQTKFTWRDALRLFQVIPYFALLFALLVTLSFVAGITARLCVELFTFTYNLL